MCGILTVGSKTKIMVGNIEYLTNGTILAMMWFTAGETRHSEQVNTIKRLPNKYASCLWQVKLQQRHLQDGAKRYSVADFQLPLTIECTA